MEDLSNEELVKQLEMALTTNENLKKNQEGLINENNQLRGAYAEATSGKSIYSKMLAVKRDLGSVGKNKNMEMNGKKLWAFRGIDDLQNHIHPILNKHGVGISTKVLQNSEEYKLNEKTGKYSKHVRLVMEYVFFAEDGSLISCQMPSEGTDTSDKATNKALSAALKYCFIQSFCIPTEDIVDSDAENVQINEVASPKVVAKTPVTSASSVSKKKSFRRKSVSNKASGETNVSSLEL